MVFTGDLYGDGGNVILSTLNRRNIHGSFFFTGNFYRNRKFLKLIRHLVKAGHYLGAHSDKHLLYCDWSNRDSLLVTKTEFLEDLRNNYAEMEKFGIKKTEARYFLPPFEWYNDSIATWTRQEGLVLINFTPGTLSPADYTTPEMKNYRSSDTIMRSILEYEQSKGMNGFILLLHIGTAPERTDKLYARLGELLDTLTDKGYSFVRIDGLFE